MYISKTDLTRVQTVFKAILEEVKNKEADVLTQYDYSSDYGVSICLTVAEIREVQMAMDSLTNSEKRTLKQQSNIRDIVRDEIVKQSRPGGLFGYKDLPNSAFKLNL